MIELTRVLLEVTLLEDESNWRCTGFVTTEPGGKAHRLFFRYPLACHWPEVLLTGLPDFVKRKGSTRSVPDFSAKRYSVEILRPEFLKKLIRINWIEEVPDKAKFSRLDDKFSVAF